VFEILMAKWWLSAVYHEHGWHVCSALYKWVVGLEFTPSYASYKCFYMAFL